MNSTVTKVAATLLLGATLATAAPAQIPHFAISDASAYVRQMLGEGSVLLKNENNALPLEKGESLALFGEAQINAYDGTLSTLTLQRGYIPFGAGSSKAYADGTLIAPLDALRMEAEAGKLSLYEPLSRAYEQNLDYVPDAAMLQGAAAAAQTAVVFLRRWMGECRDMAAADWNLSQKETDLLRAVSASFDKVVVILNTGGPIDTSWARGEVDGIRVDSLLFVGYGGMQCVLDEGQITDIAVLPAYRRRGIGAMILDALIAHARRQKLYAIFLEVRESNLPALSLYRDRFGFEVLGLRKGFYSHPKEDAYILRKEW